MNNLDEFFDSVEADQAAHVEDVKDYALHLLSTSTMKDDDDGLEDGNNRHQPNAKPLA